MAYLIDKTTAPAREQQIQEWSQLYGAPLSDKEFSEISYNLNGFFAVLREWDKDNGYTKEKVI